MFGLLLIEPVAGGRVGAGLGTRCDERPPDTRLDITALQQKHHTILILAFVSNS